jgi:excisionase family DNA binding protein
MAKQKRVVRSTPEIPAFAQLPELLTIQELMRVARIGRTTAYELTRTGAVPVLRFGRAIRVPRSVLCGPLTELSARARPAV